MTAAHPVYQLLLHMFLLIEELGMCLTNDCHDPLSIGI